MAPPLLPAELVGEVAVSDGDLSGSDVGNRSPTDLRRCSEMKSLWVMVSVPSPVFLIAPPLPSKALVG